MVGVRDLESAKGVGKYKKRQCQAERKTCEGSEVCLGDQKARMTGLWGWGREAIAEKGQVQWART